MTSLRPDERAALSEIERAQSRDITLKRGLKTALGVGTAAAGGALYSRLLPFFSEYIPKDLALKGISKISPSIGNFLQKGINQGLNIKDGFDYVKDNLLSSQPKPAKENEYNFAHFYPKLAQFIETSLVEGLPIEKAAWLAKHHPNFTKDVMKIEKESGVGFLDFIKKLFKTQGIPGVQSQQMTQPVQSPPQRVGQQAMQNLMSALQMAIDARQKRQKT